MFYSFIPQTFMSLFVPGRLLLLFQFMVKMHTKSQIEADTNLFNLVHIKWTQSWKMIWRKIAYMKQLMEVLINSNSNMDICVTFMMMSQTHRSIKKLHKISLRHVDHIIISFDISPFIPGVYYTIDEPFFHEADHQYS